MDDSTHSETLTLEPNDTHRLANLCGPFDQNLRQIEKRLEIEIRNRGNAFQLIGAERAVRNAGRLLHQLYKETRSSTGLTPESIHLHLQEAGVEELPDPVPREDDDLPELSASGGVVPMDRDGGDDDYALVRTRRKTVKARGANQRVYVDAIREHDINFGIGPAGTGKTYLAVACAVEALEAERVARILLVRPAVEAGEKLGFLPGDLAQKIDPYLRPLYDALYEMLGFERVHKLIERNVIEVAPLAYMRGRTLNNAFIILDESQNTTVEQMKMFLTRIGFGSTAVITGDVTQVDLPRGAKSGLAHVMDVLDGVAGIAFTHFGSKDVVRHPMVQRIVEAYDRFERSQVPLPLEGGGAELRTVPAARVDAGDPAP
ncbi:MAG: PhoH family protein [Pseudomonadales bacterium]|nr:PhoH family protein [Pseudomonadales bacterium]